MEWSCLPNKFQTAEQRLNITVAKVIKTSGIPLSHNEALVLTTGGTPEAAVAGIVLGFRQDRQGFNYEHTANKCAQVFTLAQAGE